MINVTRGLIIALAFGFGLVVIESVATAKTSSTNISSKQNNLNSKANLNNNFINKVIAENPSIKAEDIEKVDVDVPVAPESSEAASNSGRRKFKATAYCLRGITASGARVRRGIVAADPRVLRLGSRIHMNAGRYTGHYLVADTGGKIKGRILDIWVPSCSEARRWGRRSVHVKVVSKKRKK